MTDPLKCVSHIIQYLYVIFQHVFITVLHLDYLYAHGHTVQMKDGTLLPPSVQDHDTLSHDRITSFPLTLICIDIYT